MSHLQDQAELGWWRNFSTCFHPDISTLPRIGSPLLGNRYVILTEKEYRDLKFFGTRDHVPSD